MCVDTEREQSTDTLACSPCLTFVAFKCVIHTVVCMCWVCQSVSKQCITPKHTHPCTDAAPLLPAARAENARVAAEDTASLPCCWRAVCVVYVCGEGQQSERERERHTRNQSVCAYERVCASMRL